MRIVDMKTQSKLFFGLGLVILFLFAVSATAYWGISGVRESQERLYSQSFSNVIDFQKLSHNAVTNSAEMLALTEAKSIPEAKAQWDSVVARMGVNNDIMSRLQKRLTETQSSELLARFEKVKAGILAIRESRINTIIPLVMAGKNSDAKKIILGPQFQQRKMVEDEIENIVATSIQKAETDIETSRHLGSRSTNIFILISLLALFVGIVMVLALNRVLATPLQSISGMAEQIADGDLNVKMSIKPREDEVGMLAQSFGKMATSLRDLISQLNSGINVLASSGTEILTSTTQVAAGATETAAAVTETTSTVEEVKQAAQVSSQKARVVSDSAQKASQVAQNGKRSVEETIEGMDKIREQMESIADKILRLSEQGHAIGEIIATVNDLAEQSNLLAVNAAIEAAKSGEQGKGFAVVAQEVKSLAEQSKQATSQVRSILNEVQKATTAAVLATEQGTKAVSMGIKQAEESRQAISQLAETVSEAAKAAMQIAASSQQQLVGMDQVVTAMESIKQATSQNVSNTKGVEATAKSLHNLGQNLKEMVERFTTA